jgi:hypothetical protein
MRLILALIVILGLAGLAAHLTRPGEAEFDAALDAAVRDRIARTDVGEGSDGPLAEIALAACKLRPSDCIELLRRSMDVQFEERAFTTRATVEARDRRASCIGAFGRFWGCRKVLG